VKNSDIFHLKNFSEIVVGEIETDF